MLSGHPHLSWQAWMGHGECPATTENITGPLPTISTVLIHQSRQHAVPAVPLAPAWTFASDLH